MRAREHTWCCDVCDTQITQTIGKGFTNLVNHVKTKHNNYEEILRKGVYWCCISNRLMNMSRYVNMLTLNHYSINILDQKQATMERYGTARQQNIYS